MVTNNGFVKIAKVNHGLFMHFAYVGIYQYIDKICTNEDVFVCVTL
jgi:hypothetical protein